MCQNSLLIILNYLNYNLILLTVLQNTCVQPNLYKMQLINHSNLLNSAQFDFKLHIVFFMYRLVLVIK